MNYCTMHLLVLFTGQLTFILSDLYFHVWQMKYVILWQTFVIRSSSVASPICQEGQSERTFPIFASSSRFFPFFPRFYPLFPDFWQIFRCQGWHSAPLAPQVATPLIRRYLQKCKSLFYLSLTFSAATNTLWNFIDVWRGVFVNALKEGTFFMKKTPSDYRCSYSCGQSPFSRCAQ